MCERTALHARRSWGAWHAHAAVCAILSGRSRSPWSSRGARRPCMLSEALNPHGHTSVAVEMLSLAAKTWRTCRIRFDDVLRMSETSFKLGSCVKIKGQA